MYYIEFPTHGEGLPFLSKSNLRHFRCSFWRFDKVVCWIQILLKLTAPTRFLPLYQLRIGGGEHQVEAMVDLIFEEISKKARVL